MIFIFENQMIREDGINRIEVPFNVWEVNSEQGPLSAEITINSQKFTCIMEPKGKGHYYLTVPEKVAEKLEPQDSYKVSFGIKERVKKETPESPYSLTNPIRSVDQISLVRQPWDGLCGQACIAMLAGISLEEAGEIMQCREWQASMEKIVESLNYLGIAHSDTIYYNCGNACLLPKCAVLLLKLGRYSHYLIYFDGKYYDPSEGISDNIDEKQLIGFFEIL